MNWKKLLRQLKLEDIKAKAPGFFEASGGYNMKIVPYKDNTSNGLTRCICDYISFIGGYSNRITTTGTMRKINGRMVWTKGNSNKGAADIRILYKGRSFDIEVKIGKDKMSDAQIKEQQRIQVAGGHYFVAKSFPEFLEWWQSRGFSTLEKDEMPVIGMIPTA